MQQAHKKRQLAAKIRVGAKKTNGTENNDTWDGPELDSIKNGGKNSK